MNARSPGFTSSRHAPFAAVALGALAACHGSAEVVVTVPGDPVYSEAEPNDDAFTADDFGTLSAGEHVCIEGSVRDDAYDPQDGFAFTATGPIVVDFTLDAGCACADLDVWIYDPLLDEFVGVFDSPSSSERGTFTVYSQSFHVVVVSAAGDASYRLDVRATPIYAALAAGADTVAVGAADHPSLPARAPGPLLEKYRRPAERGGAPRLTRFFVIDPDRGVLAQAWVPAAD
ncbi:MAG: hypothetical protein NTY35_12245 [Planctomycetota bacterium]|nr:hypothetical protein [Planctomycetota bacterium]